MKRSFTMWAIAVVVVLSLLNGCAKQSEAMPIFVGNWVEEWPGRTGNDDFTVTSDEQGVHVTAINRSGTYRYRIDSERIDGDILSFRLVVVESGYVLSYKVEPIDKNVLRSTITGAKTKTVQWRRKNQ